MKDDAPQPSIQELSSKINHLALGLKWLCAAVLLVLSIPNFLACLSIDYFAQLFKDALPGKPLPGLTELIIHHSSLLLISAFCWPSLGILSVIFGKKAWGWITVSLIMGLIIFQILATFVGLYMPLFSMPVGMSDSSAH